MKAHCELCGKEVQALQWGYVICAACVPKRNAVLTVVKPKNKKDK